MKRLDPDAPWMPYHVVLGQSVSHHSVQDYEISDELREAGVNSSNMRSKLVLSARAATLAINNMLASVL